MSLRVFVRVWDITKRYSAHQSYFGSPRCLAPPRRGRWKDSDGEARGSHEFVPSTSLDNLKPSVLSSRQQVSRSRLNHQYSAESCVCKTDVVHSHAKSAWRFSFQVRENFAGSMNCGPIFLAPDKSTFPSENWKRQMPYRNLKHFFLLSWTFVKLLIVQGSSYRSMSI